MTQTQTQQTSAAELRRSSSADAPCNTAMRRLEQTIDEARRAHQEETGVGDDKSFLLWMHTRSGELWQRRIEEATRQVQEQSALAPSSID